MSTSPVTSSSCRRAPSRARSCAGRRTANRRTPRSSAAGGRGARPRPRARAGRTPRAISSSSSIDGSNSATQTKQSGRLTYSLMSSIGMSASLRPVLVGDAADQHGRAIDSRDGAASMHARTAYGGRTPLIDCASSLSGYTSNDPRSFDASLALLDLPPRRPPRLPARDAAAARDCCCC